MAEPVLVEPFRFDELLSVDPVLGVGWLLPLAGLFAEGDPDMPRVAPPVAAVPQGRPLAPIRPELLELVELAAVFGFEVLGVAALGFVVLWLMALGFDALGHGLPGVVAVLPGAVPVTLAPPVAPVAAPVEPPLAPPLLCASASPVLPRRAIVASKAKRCLVCGMYALL